MILVGNKCDMESEREVTEDEGKILAKNLEIPYIEISVKMKKNVDKVFYSLVRELIKVNNQPKVEQNQKNCIIL